MFTAVKAQAVTKFWFDQESGICLHHFRYPVGRLDYLPHTHDEYNVVICLEGSFEYRVRETQELLGPGDVLVINPGDLHHGEYGCGPRDSTGLTLHVSERAMKSILGGMRLPIDADRSSVSFFGKVHDPALLDLTEELLGELQQRQSGFEMVSQALILQLIVHLLRCCLHPVVQTPRKVIPKQLPSWQMVRALEYMNANGKSSFRLVDLCANAGTSPTRFIQLFKNSVVNGINPHAFYNHLIVNKAKRLLREPAISVKEVSYELGFHSESHFCKVFRSCTGLTPGRFRLSEPSLELPLNRPFSYS